MDPLIDEAWRIYEQTKDDDAVVRPSIPILFFGDSERYACSPLKVITVGLNPSRKEFPVHDRFSRFRPASSVDSRPLDDAARAAYLTALNGYFRCDPYRTWFDWFEQVLLGLGVSYYGHEPNTALHTDLCSPLATDPTWTLLGPRQERYEAAGMALWHRLVDRLSPEVIVISIARRYRDQITFADPQAWRPIIALPKSRLGSRPYVAWMQEGRLSNGVTMRLLFGQAAQQPFATLDKERRRQIGRAFLERINER